MLNKKRIIIVGFIILLAVIGIFLYTKKANKAEKDIGYRKSVNVVDIKNEKGIDGEDDLYEIKEEYDGRKTISVKLKYLFEVAILGLYQDVTSIEDYGVEDIENRYNELKDTVFVEEGGVIILPKDQSKVLKILNDNSNCNYYFDDNNYLKMSNNGGEEILNEFDKNFLEIINSTSKTIIIAFEKEYFTIDDVTGKIVSYPYCDLDPYMEYESVKFDNYEVRFVNPSVENTSFLSI